MPKIVEDTAVYHAAMQVVIKRGYSGATTKEIAAAANISEVTLFRKYNSKTQLVKQAITAMAEETDFASAAQYTGDIQSDLLRVVKAYKKTVDTHGQFFSSIVLEMQRIDELAETINAPVTIFRSIGALMERYQAAGVLQPEEPLHAVAGLLGPLIYTTLIRPAILDDDPPLIDLQRHVSFYLEGRRS